MESLQEICKEIEGKYLNAPELTKKVKTLCRFWGKKMSQELNFPKGEMTKEDIYLAIDITRRVGEKEKGISQILEEDILAGLAWFADAFGEKIAEKIAEKKEVRQFLNEELLNNVTNEEDKETIEISLKIKNLAYDLIAITKSKDAFSGARKGYATSILTALNKGYKIEGLAKVFIANFKYKGAELLANNLESIQAYYELGENEGIVEIVDLINERIEKVKKRGVLTGYLDTLIKLNEISEFEAMELVNDWKAKRKY